MARGPEHTNTDPTGEGSSSSAQPVGPGPPNINGDVITYLVIFADCTTRLAPRCSARTLHEARAQQPPETRNHLG
jgi:hypothetical protein